MVLLCQFGSFDWNCPCWVQECYMSALRSVGCCSALTVSNICYRSFPKSRVTLQKLIDVYSDRKDFNLKSTATFPNRDLWEKKILSTWDVWPTISLTDTCNLATGPVFWSPWQSASHSSVCVRQEMQVETGTALIYPALLIIKARCYPEVFTVTEGQSNREDTARGLCSGAQGV